MALTRSAGVLAILTALAVPRTGPAQAVPQGLLGTWRLVEYWDRDSIAAPRRDTFGARPCGYIIYTTTGHVSVQLAHGPVPPRLPSDSVREDLPRDSAEAFGMLRRHVSYFGTFTVDASRGVVVHHVEADSRLLYTNTHEERPFRLRGDTLVIGDERTWRRVLVRDTPSSPPNRACAAANR